MRSASSSFVSAKQRSGQCVMEERIRSAVLIVDDEEIMRSLLQMWLKHSGVRTFEARNGIEALTIVESEGANLSAVLLDLSLPIVSGVEVYKTIKSQRPSLPILVMSGYSSDTVQAAFLNELDSPVLTKPFTFADLTKAMELAIG